MTNQGRFSNRPCEYCHEVDVIISRAFNFTTKTYEVIARDSKTNQVHTCLGERQTNNITVKTYQFYP